MNGRDYWRDDKWIEYAATELSELNDDEFERAWEDLGKTVFKLSRIRRAEEALDEARQS